MAKVISAKLTLKQMLVSSFPSYDGGGPMPPAGAARALCDLYTQFLDCRSLQSVFAIALLLACHFFSVFFPTLPSLFSSGPSITKYWLVSIPLNSSM